VRRFRAGTVATLIGVSVWTAPAIARAGDLTIAITGLSSREGTLRIAVFDRPERFLREDGRVVGVELVLATVATGADPVSVTLHGVAPGRYAVSVHHDRDGDGQRATNLLGVPTEAVGFSNGAKGTLGPPSFEAAAFEVGTPPVRVPIRLTPSK
jgi:uncharacterized protein (DUF2141 family)